MEGDSTGEIGSSLMFDFDFDDEIHLIDNPHDINQAHPNHQNQMEKLGSSSGSNPPVSMRTRKQNLTKSSSAHTNTTEHFDSSVENAPNVTPPRPSSSLVPDPLQGTPQASHPTTAESSELHSPPETQNKQPPAASDQVNSDTNLSGDEHISQDSTATTSHPLVVAPNLSPMLTSSLSTPLSGTTPPQVPYLSTMTNVELGSSIGSNQSFLNYVNSGQSFMGGPSYSVFEGTDPSLGSATNVLQSKSFFHSPFSAIKSQQYLQSTHGESITQNQNSVVPAFYSETEMSSKHPKQLNTRSQNELLHSQHGISPLNISSSLSADQLEQNQRPLNPYPTSFSHSSTGLGNVNQQLPTWLSNPNAPFMPLTPPRPQQSANQLQYFNQLPENVFNPQSQSSMIPEYPTLHRPQHLPYQTNQVSAVANPLEPQRCNTLMPDPSMALSLRIPELNGRSQSMLPGPLMFPGSETFELPGLLNQQARSTVAYHRPSSSQLKQIFNPANQQKIGGYNPTGAQLELSLCSRNEQTSLGRRRRGRASSRYEPGESSSSNKRSKISNLSYGESVFQERVSTCQSLEDGINNPFISNPFNTSRPLKNTVYDPIFEGIGLPIDPHLRLFNAN